MQDQNLHGKRDPFEPSAPVDVIAETPNPARPAECEFTIARNSLSSRHWTVLAYSAAEAVDIVCDETGFKPTDLYVSACKPVKTWPYNQADHIPGRVYTGGIAEGQDD